MLVILAGALVVALLLNAGHGATIGSLVAAAMVIGLYLAYMVIAMPRRLRARMANVWKTYEIEIGPNFILRRQAGLPDLCVRFDDLKRIEHMPGRYLRVFGNGVDRIIWIPVSIENFEEIFMELSTVTKVIERHVEFWKLQAFYMGLGLAAFAVMLWAHWPWVVIPLAVVLSALIVGIFVWTRRSPNVPHSTKMAAWAYIALLLVCWLKVVAVLQG